MEARYDLGDRRRGDCPEHRRVMPSKEPSIRDGVREDAAHLTRVVDLASEGLALAMWTELAGADGDPWVVGRERAMRTEGAFSWRNARVCTHDGEVAGALIGYRIGDRPQPVDGETPAVFRPLLELENRAPGTFYVNVLATLAAHRRTGVAKRLIADAVRRANGSDLSLVVASGNEAARTLYRAMEFVDVASESAVGGFGWTPHFSQWILMRRSGSPD